MKFDDILEKLEMMENLGILNFKKSNPYVFVYKVYVNPITY